MTILKVTLTFALLVQLTLTADSFFGSQLSNEVWITAENYAGDPGSTLTKTVKNSSKCKCRMACFTVPDCNSATLDSNSICSLYEDKGSPQASPGSTFFYKPTKFVMKEDGLFYYLTKGTANFYGIDNMCTTEGGRLAIGRTKQTFDIMRKFQTDSGASIRVGARRAAFNDTAVWDDGNLVDLTFLESSDSLFLWRIDVASGYVFHGGRFTDSVPLYIGRALCQANYLGKFW